MSYTYNHGSVTLNTAGGIAGSGASSGSVLVSGTGGSGSGYTISTGAGTTSVPLTYTTGTNVTWTNPTTNPVMVAKNDPPELEVKGRMVLNGVDLEERLTTIEKVLQIPERDVKLEKKHPKLKKMYDDYIKALAKYRTWDAIKGDDDGTT